MEMTIAGDGDVSWVVGIGVGVDMQRGFDSWEKLSDEQRSEDSSSLSSAMSGLGGNGGAECRLLLTVLLIFIKSII